MNDREGHTESTPVDKYYSTWPEKAFDVAPNFNYRRPLYKNLEGCCVYRKLPPLSFKFSLISRV